MPVQVLNGSEPASVTPPAVLGENYETTTFITHVALLDPEEGGPVQVLRDPPPRVAHVRKKGFFRNTEIRAYVCGWLGGLTEEEADDAVAQLKVIFQDFETKLIDAARAVIEVHWQAHPPFSTGTVEGQLDETEGKVVYHRYFSCAGFVVWCINEVLERWLVVGTEELPVVGFEEVGPFYGMRGDPEELEECGLAGPGPWRLLLPGYVINALGSPEAAAGEPYRPRGLEDAYYPPNEG
jgi:hypothetical protein